MLNSEPCLLDEGRKRQTPLLYGRWHQQCLDRAGKKLRFLTKSF